jgi:hypothetical protein
MTSAPARPPARPPANRQPLHECRLHGPDDDRGESSGENGDTA